MKKQSFSRSGRTSNKYLSILLLLLLFGMFPVSVNAVDTAHNQVAMVNDTVLTEADLQEALNEIIPAGVFHGGFSAEKRMEYRPQAFEKMVEKELFYQEAVGKGLQIDRTLIETRRDNTIKRLGGMKRFEAALKKSGISDQQYQNKLMKEQLIEALITSEIVSKALVTEAEAAEYYQTNKSKFMRPEARKIRQIQISVAPNAPAEEWVQKRLKAQEVVDKIESGEDMAAVAWEYSEDKYRVKGGDLGLVHRGRLDPALEDEIFKLEKDQLSGVIETIHGYHVVRVEEVRPAEQLSLDDISTKVSNELRKEKEAQLRTELIRRLRDEARIEIY